MQQEPNNFAKEAKMNNLMPRHVHSSEALFISATLRSSRLLSVDHEVANLSVRACCGQRARA